MIDNVYHYDNCLILQTLILVEGVSDPPVKREKPEDRQTRQVKP